MLEAARGRSREGAWLAVAARIASIAGDLAKALELWKQVAGREPTNVGAHAAAAQALAGTEGRTAAVAWLSDVVARIPQHLGLVRLWVEWHRDDGPFTMEAATRTVTEGPDAFGAAKEELETARRRLPSFASHRGLRRAYKRAVRRVAKRRGGVGAWLWQVRELLCS